ncbi:unnamed protein product [Prunus armeniaca]
MPKSISSDEPKPERKVAPSSLGWPEGKVGPSSNPCFGADVSAIVPLKSTCRSLGSPIKFFSPIQR